MSEEPAPCPVCETELVLQDEGHRGICPVCGEALYHRDGEIVVDEEHEKGVEVHEITIPVTIETYGTTDERALSKERKNLERLLTGGRNTWQYRDDRVEVGK